MNNLNFNEDNNGVVRKTVTERICEHKQSIIGIIAGMILVVTMAFLTSSNIDAVDDGKRNLTNTTTCSTETTTTATTTTSTVTTLSTSSIPLTTVSSDISTIISTTTEDTTSVIVTTEETTETTVDTEDDTNIDESTDVEETNASDDNNDTSEPTPEYIVYKPSTHYVHKNTCRWVTDECQEITSTEGIECRKCSECNPDIEIITRYETPQPEPVTYGTALDYITETEYIYLCNTVGREYGSDWVSIYDKACVVAVIMNRVHDGGWSNGLPSTIYNVLTAPYQFNPAYCTDYYQYCVTQSCKDAVDYYFAHQNEFPHYTSFWGDGRMNHFS